MIGRVVDNKGNSTFKMRRLYWGTELYFVYQIRRCCAELHSKLKKENGGINMKTEFVEDREYSHKIDELRLNRVKMSFYKYGPAKINFGDRLVNALESHDLCIEKYKKTKNTEYLLDAMNYLMFEYMYPQEDGAFFQGNK